MSGTNRQTEKKSKRKGEIKENKQADREEE